MRPVPMLLLQQRQEKLARLGWPPGEVTGQQGGQHLLQRGSELESWRRHLRTKPPRLGCGPSPNGSPAPACPSRTSADSGYDAFGWFGYRAGVEDRRDRGDAVDEARAGAYHEAVGIDGPDRGVGEPRDDGARLLGRAVEVEPAWCDEHDGGADEVGYPVPSGERWVDPFPRRRPVEWAAAGRPRSRRRAGSAGWLPVLGPVGRGWLDDLT